MALADKTLVRDAPGGDATPQATLVRRSATAMLLADAGAPVTVLTAPAGYGKTTLLREWAGLDPRPFAWVSMGPGTGSGAGLQAAIEAALDDVAETPPFVLVLDGADDAAGCAAAIELLVDRIPAGSQVVLSGRSGPGPSIARLRAAGRLLELGMADLALDPAQAAEVARGEGLEPGGLDMFDLLHRTEGWPAAIQLAVLALGDAGAGRVARRARWEGGRDRYIADYVWAEHLSALSRRRLEFLTRASVLERLSGPLCDAVLGGSGWARLLHDLEHEDPMVIPLDAHREWYRFHRLYREVLRTELDLREPGAAAGLCRAAAAWHEGRGELEPAIAYAADAGDTDTLARLVSDAALPAYQRGCAAAVERWLDEFDREELLARYPQVGAAGALVLAFEGRSEQSGRWARVVERARPGEGDSLEPCVAVLRAVTCGRGLERAAADADRALEGLSEFSRWRPLALVMRGVSLLLGGDGDRADAALADAADAAAASGAGDALALALAERAIRALDRGAPARAEVLADGARRAVDEAELDSYPSTALVLAVAARCSVARGAPERARAQLAQAALLRARLTHAVPWLAIQTRLQLAAGYLALADPLEARTLLLEIDDILHRRPDMGGQLMHAAESLRTQIQTLVSNGDGGWVSTLTTAELRLLPLLASPWSFREIAERLYLSRNTVKTEAISIYRKLGVSSRTAALHRAAELGLLDQTLLPAERPLVDIG